jgi:hypothetical protein
MTGSKILSVGLIAVAILTVPAMAKEHRNVAKQTDVSAQWGDFNGRGCVRAPNVGAYASDPYTQPPCEPTWYN